MTDFWAPGIRTFIEKVESFVVPEDADLETKRRAYAAMCAAMSPGMPNDVSSCDGQVGDIPIRVYRPTRVYRPRACREDATLLFVHGGGFILGDLETHHPIVAELVQRTGLAAVAVGYRKAPEHRYPAAMDDCLAVLAAVRRGDLGLPVRAVGLGESAGATLVAGMALRARDEGIEGLIGQVLIHPALDIDLRKPSFVAKATAPLLRTDEMGGYLDAYLGPLAADPPAYAMPLRADDLSRVPPAFIVVMEHDPLHDDGIDYARRLRRAGSGATLYDAAGLPHGSLRMWRHAPAAAAMHDAVCRAVMLFTDGSAG